MKSTANQKLPEFEDKLIVELRELIEEFTIPASGNMVKNAYYIIDEIGYSFTLLCAGIELRQPISRFDDDGRFVISAQFTKDYLKIDAFCD